MFVKTSTLVAILSLCICGPALATTWSAYDNFVGGAINPAKWSAWDPNASTTLDVERMIVNNHLALALTTHGQRSSSSGATGDGNYLTILNFPLYKGLAAKARVDSRAATLCPANTGVLNTAQLEVDASFFNTGSGLTSDDLHAFLVARHLAGGGPGLEVIGFLEYQNNFFNIVHLGTIATGTMHTFSVFWNAGLSRIDFNLDNVTKSSPYTMTNARAAAGPFGVVGVYNSAANCQAITTNNTINATVTEVSVAK